MKKVLLKTYGCKVNQYETQLMRENLMRNGFSETEEAEKADLLVLNTCTVTGESDRKCGYFLRNFLRKRPEAKVVLTGCFVENDYEKASALPGVTMALKNGEKTRVAEKILGIPEKIAEDDFIGSSIKGFSEHKRVFLKVQDGCDNECSYCKVTQVRGRSKSKPEKAVMEEAENLAKGGYREIVLTGIQLGAYGRDLGGGLSLSKLIRKILDHVPLIERVRLSSIGVNDVDEDLMDLLSHEPKFCRHLHIPLQSGDDNVLDAMNRHYSSSDFRNLVQLIKYRVENFAFTTDVMVGFPAENEARFENTLHLLERLEPLRTHVFPYSQREGTKAYSMGSLEPGFVKEHVKKAIEFTGELSFNFRRKMEFKTLDVLVERESRDNFAREALHLEDPDTVILEGYTGNYIRVFFRGEKDLINKVVPVRLTNTFGTASMGYVPKS